MFLSLSGSRAIPEGQGKPKGQKVKKQLALNPRENVLNNPRHPKYSNSHDKEATVKAVRHGHAQSLRARVVQRTLHPLTKLTPLVHMLSVLGQSMFNVDMWSWDIEFPCTLLPISHFPS